MITGFRHALGGYQQVLGVTPDLTTFGKGMANGFPIGGLAGRRDLMEHFNGQTGDVLMAGTFNGNPLACVAALATIGYLQDHPDYYQRTFAFGERLRTGLTAIVDDLGIEATVAGFGGVFALYFAKSPVLGYRDLMRNNNTGLRRLPPGNDRTRFPDAADGSQAQPCFRRTHRRGHRAHPRRGPGRARRPARQRRGGTGMSSPVYPAHDTIFTWAAPPLRIGLGAVEEIAFELAKFAPARVLLVTDKQLTATGWPARVAALIRAGGMHCGIYDDTHVEPTDASMAAAVAAARDSGPWDAFVALGGGSVMDTAKVVNLLSTNPGELAEYLNAPLGAGRAPVNPLRPLVAVPTTAGTGAECTAVAIMDVLDLRVKTGISNPQLRPVAAIVDPQLTMSVNPQVSAASGMDVLCHAVESLTARPYDAVPRKRAEQRAVYCGSNPISDVWTEHALGLLATALRTVVRDGSDTEARTRMMLAATYAGMGFGNAGVHLPHAAAYPIAGQVPSYHATGWPGDEPLVPHGQAVSLTAPAVFRFTFAADPQRHLRAAMLLDPTVADLPPAEQLPTALIRLMRDIGIPNGIGAVGFTKSHIDSLVAGTRAQQRLLAQAPVQPTDEDLAAIFTDSLTNW